MDKDINLDEEVTLTIRELAFLYSCVGRGLSHVDPDVAVAIAINGDWKNFIHVAYDTTIECRDWLEDYVEQLK